MFGGLLLYAVLMLGENPSLHFREGSFIYVSVVVSWLRRGGLCGGNQRGGADVREGVCLLLLDRPDVSGQRNYYDKSVAASV